MKATREMQQEILSNLSLRLKPIKFAACVWCSQPHDVVDEAWQQINVYLSDSLYEEAMRCAASWYCYGSEARTIRYPADWWEAVKERWAPQWFLTRWPVRRTLVSVRAMFPELTVMGRDDSPIDIRKETA